MSQRQKRKTKILRPLMTAENVKFKVARDNGPKGWGNKFGNVADQLELIHLGVYTATDLYCTIMAVQNMVMERWEIEHGVNTRVTVY
jgi:hypothetical protein